MIHMGNLFSEWLSFPIEAYHFVYTEMLRTLTYGPWSVIFMIFHHLMPILGLQKPD